VAQFLDTVAKLSFINNLTPVLNKDMRVIQLEQFYRANFTTKQNGLSIKAEVLKLQNGSKEMICGGKNSVTSYGHTLKNLTYEELL